MNGFGKSFALIGMCVLPQAVTGQAYDPRQCSSQFMPPGELKAFCEGYRSGDGARCGVYMSMGSSLREGQACREGVAAHAREQQARGNSAVTQEPKRPATVAARPAAGNPQTRGVLLSPDVGYACPDGSQLRYFACQDESADSICTVQNLHLPLQNGLILRTPTTRRELIARLQACQPRRVVIDGNGHPRLTDEVRR